jgi:hypothetical protein
LAKDNTKNMNKYAKFTVKRKKVDSQLVERLATPRLVISGTSSNSLGVFEANPMILRFWEKLSLRPRSAPKPVLYFALTPSSDCLFQTLEFFSQFSTIYEVHTGELAVIFTLTLSLDM